LRLKSFFTTLWIFALGIMIFNSQPHFSIQDWFLWSGQGFGGFLCCCG
jgi:hypothetical protein